MASIKFRDFWRFVKRKDAHGYNRKLAEITIDGTDVLFEGAVILDAGAGRHLKDFKRQHQVARYVVGVDLSLDDIRINSDIDSGVVGNVELLPFQPTCFGCILSVDVVEHLVNPRAFFHEAVRCLEPGGAFIVCTPNLLGYKNLITYLLPRSMLDFLWRRIKGRSGQPHRTYYRANTVHQIRQLAASEGLVVEQVHYLNEISHFFYPSKVLSTAAYLYGRVLEALRLTILLPYIICIMRKKSSMEVR